MPSSHNVADTWAGALSSYSRQSEYFEIVKLARQNGESKIHSPLPSGLTAKNGPGISSAATSGACVESRPNYASRADVEKLLSELRG
jgi:hypothetical protein